MKKTELKDVVHLYVGQQMTSYWGDFKERQTIVGVIGPLVILKFSEEDGVQESVDLSFGFPEGKEPKLVLRPLSGMTSKEKQQLSEIMKDTKEGKNLLPEIKSGRLLNLFVNREDPGIILWLLNKGFDIFNLIGSGQAEEKHVPSTD